jgi:hypothetical protein
MKRIPFLVRIPPRDHASLKLAAKAYRAPSINWFVGEMLQCMLNPARWTEFQMRLTNGQQQLTLELQAEATKAANRPGKARKGPSRVKA